MCVCEAAVGDEARKAVLPRGRLAARPGGARGRSARPGAPGAERGPSPRPGPGAAATPRPGRRAAGKPCGRRGPFGQLYRIYLFIFATEIGAPAGGV